MKKILAMLVAVCLMMSLAIPAFATETTTTAAETTAAATTETTTGTETTAGTEATTGEDGHDHDHDHTTETTGEAKEDSAAVKAIRIVLIVLEVIASVVLIVIVLLQSGKEAGLSGALSGNSDSYLNKNGMGNLDKTLAKATKWVALAWLILTLALSLI